MKFSNILSSMIFLLGMAVSPVSAGVIFSDDFAGGIGNWTTSGTIGSVCSCSDPDPFYSDQASCEGDGFTWSCIPGATGDVIPDAGRMRLWIYQCANAAAYRDLGNAPGNITIDFDWATSFDNAYSEKFRWGLELISDGSSVWLAGFPDQAVASGHASKTVYAAGNLRLRYWLEPYVEWCFFGDHGNTYFWIDNVVIAPTISGNAYADEAAAVWSKCDGATANISLVSNGGAAATTSCEAATGAYSFSGQAVAAGDPISVFFNTTGGNTDKGVAVTVAADATSALTLNPRKNIVWVKTEGAVANITNANLDHCDSASPADCANVPYTVTTSNLTVSAGTELYIESGKTFAPGGNITTPSMKSLGTFNGGSGSIDINGPLTINGGAFTATSSTMNIAGDFTVSGGTFSHNGGAVIFDGVGQSISGNNTFNNFTKSVVSAETFTVTAGSTQTFTGTVTLGGASGQLLSLRSSTPGTKWNFNLAAGATKAISYVDAQDSDASGSEATQKPIYPVNSVDSGNDVGWFTYQIVKQVYDANGNCLAGSPSDAACNGSATTITVPVGPQLKFLLFVRNTAAVAMNDVRFQDLLDDGPTGFTYTANTIKYDVSQSDVATIANIYSAVNSGTVQTDALDGDYVSVIDTNAGNGLDKLTVGRVAGQANAQVDIPAHTTLAVLFQATKK